MKIVEPFFRPCISKLSATLNKTLLIVIIAILQIGSLSAQDLIYIVSGDIDNVKTSLDSILVENLSNSTRIVFGNLPVRTEYQINLTKKAFWGTTGEPLIHRDNGFMVLKNLPGNLTIGYSGRIFTKARFDVYTMNGQKAFSTSYIFAGPASPISIKLGNAGVYFVKALANHESQTFKAIGMQGSGVIQIRTEDIISTGQSVSFNKDAMITDFSYQTGDSIRVSVYKKSYFAYPKNFRIDNSKSLPFKLLSPPTINTGSVSSITQAAATSGGNVITDGGATVTARGVCWNTAANPTTNNNKTTDGTGTGSFISNLTGLTANTSYYVRAYAINIAGIAYGNQVTFTTTQDVFLPSVNTSAPSLVLAKSAIIGGNVTSDGNSTVTERGICWGTTQNPTTANNKLIVGSGTGAFSNKITGLSANTTYYARAYAINSKGTAYGNEVNFINPAGTFTDSRDSRLYKWVQIGNQVWMAENLDYLPSVNPRTVKSDVIKYFYVYGYSGYNVGEAKASENYVKYGVLYNWAAAMNGAPTSNSVPSGVQGICPSGWHVPSYAEWVILFNYLGTGGGGKLKETGTENWRTPNTLATNESDFTARPGGYMSGTGYLSDPGLFTNQNSIGTFWSTRTYDASPDNAWRFFVRNDSGDLSTQGDLRTSGVSVRCVKD